MLKKINLHLILFFVLFTVLTSNAQKNDSLNKKEHKFMLGITIAPNYSWRKYNERPYANYLFSIGRPEDEQPAIGYSILLNEKIALRRFVFNIGLGAGFYNYKGNSNFEVTGSSGNPGYLIDYNYVYKHKFIEEHNGCGISFGKKKLWIVGIATDLSYIYRLTQKVETVYNSIPTSKNLTTYDFTAPKFIGWGGIGISRTIKAAKWLNILVALEFKYSTNIRANSKGDVESYFEISQDRNLMTSSINITFYPRFKQK